MRKHILTFFTIAAMMTAASAIAQPDIEAPETLVVTGTVVNASPDEIVLETESGSEIFIIDKEDLYPEPILEGTIVTVWFTERADHRYATQLKVGDHAHADHTHTATLDADVDTEVHVHHDPEPGIEAEIHTHVEPDLEADVDLDTEVDTTTTTYDTTYDNDRYRRLPQTASNHPLLALLGLIGLAGAAVIWQIRK